MTYETPEELLYTEDHEWALKDGDLLVVGITDFAQSSLGDIVFTELPSTGTQLKKGETFGVVESIKSVSDLYMPIDGEIIANNSALEDSPELINDAPYEHWLIKVRPTKTTDTETLLSPKEYTTFCAEC